MTNARCTALHVLAIALAITLGGASSARAQGAVKADLPDSLTSQAKVTEAAARATARARVRHGIVRAVELERERGHLQYSYDMTIPGRPGITEVNVDALTGQVIGVSRESARDERREAEREHERKP